MPLLVGVVMSVRTPLPSLLVQVLSATAVVDIYVMALCWVFCILDGLYELPIVYVVPDAHERPSLVVAVGHQDGVIQSLSCSLHLNF